ncbi:hypothetical protein T12_7008 [Trichinella patagoniensis]|nr:hypothetical protein T12_7008 [Trichinella patagoniensis]
MPNYLSDYVLTAQTSSPSSFHEGKIDIQHIDSENQKADILTKALPKTFSELALAIRNCF